MVKKVFLVAGALLLVASLISAADTSTWTGVVSDSHCGLKHSKASAQAAACVEKCVAGGGKYVFVADGKLYQVEPQDKFRGLGGKAVTVKGSIAGDTITADSVEPAAGQ